MKPWGKPKLLPRSFHLVARLPNLSWAHHLEVTYVDDPRRWLDLAQQEEWSRNELHAASKQGAAATKTQQTELEAKKLASSDLCLLLRSFTESHDETNSSLHTNIAHVTVHSSVSMWDTAQSVAV
jgi:hypothetical protein